MRRCTNTQGSSQILPCTRIELPIVRIFDHTTVARSPQLQPVEGFGLPDERGSRSCVGVQYYNADCSTTIQLIVRLSTRFGVDLATRSAGPFDVGSQLHIWGEIIKYRTVVVRLSFGNLWGHSISNPHRTTKENNFLKHENNHLLTVLHFPPPMGTHLLQTSFTKRSLCFRVTKWITILTSHTLCLFWTIVYIAPLPTVATNKRTSAERVPTKPKPNYMQLLRKKNTRNV